MSLKKVDYNMVTLYTIHVTKSDHTGYFMHYLDETIASQEFWKALKNEGYCQITINKEPHIIADLPEEIRKKVHAERIEKEKEEANCSQEKI